MVVAIVALQASEIEASIVEKESVKNLLADKGAGRETCKKRSETVMWALSFNLPAVPSFAAVTRCGLATFESATVTFFNITSQNVSSWTLINLTYEEFRKTIGTRGHRNIDTDNAVLVIGSSRCSIIVILFTFEMLITVNLITANAKSSLIVRVQKCIRCP